MRVPSLTTQLVSYVPVKDEDVIARRARRMSSGLADCGCTGLGMELETTVDQALIRGLVTAFRVFVSGLSSV
jgi:hypothetical protein